MSTLNRILNKLTDKPSIIDKTKDIIGFSLTKTDRKNISTLLKRQYVEFNNNITDNDMLRLYLNTQYTYENHRTNMEAKLKKEERESKKKVNRMLEILKDSRVKQTKMSNNNGRRFVKLVK
tara:strand:+ start:1058 stop:1420 length:363 start_codon:yes stop_codon:yes gene_type:complete